MKSLGTVKKRHVSGMMETNKGFKMPAIGGVEIGDELVEENGKRYFISGEDYKEIVATQKPKFKKGVTKVLREEAAELGITVTEDMSKDEVVDAMNEAKLDLGDNNDLGGDE